MPRYFLPLVALAAAFIVLWLAVDKQTRFRPAPAPAQAPAPAAAKPALPPEHNDTVDTLPPGPGREETFARCAACHGTAIIKQQGMTRAQWDASIDYMIQRHGMVVPDDAERVILLNYLEAQFPPRNRPRGRDNPFLPKQ